MILVDSSVLIDVIEGKPHWSGWSSDQLFISGKKHRLIVNVVIYAEISRSFSSAMALDQFLQDVGIKLDFIPAKAAFQAARAHTAYRAAGGTRSATLPDFFIGAHASVCGGEMLTRDPKRIRAYFPDVVLICPE